MARIRRKVARAFAFAFVLVSIASPAWSQHEAVHRIASFQFESGATLDDMKVGYVTYGQRTANDENVIVLLPPTSGLKNWAAAHIGKGKLFDPEKYFIVSIDAIGGGTSSQPRDGLGARFPQYNIRDMVRAQHELLTKALGIQRALAICGASSGAYQALEWGVQYPDFARSLLLWAGAARADMQVKSIVDGIVATLTLDPAFASGQAVPAGGDAVRRASTVYFPWLASEAGLNTFASDEELVKAEAGFADNWARNWDAIGLAWRYRSSRLHNVGEGQGGKVADALQRVTAAVFILAVSTDRTHSLALNEEMRQGLRNAKVTWSVLDSPRGHLAVFRGPGTAEFESVQGRTREFLDSLR
ncbi:alpha/beta fold hydrolase [Ramlibacter solisilvae]|uniref:alpha/beta fold hydrolase n=1 Tax=Ramlibacter tataouinensis TaxID=94132 RepID=UPI0013149006|nr:alpha/beta fold hydrolase [Ramlibacter tataouinensis]